jgi:hypothetical protein
LPLSIPLRRAGGTMEAVREEKKEDEEEEEALEEKMEEQDERKRALIYEVEYIVHKFQQIFDKLLLECTALPEETKNSWMV